MKSYQKANDTNFVLDDLRQKRRRAFKKTKHSRLFVNVVSILLLLIVSTLVAAFAVYLPR